MRQRCKISGTKLARQCAYIASLRFNVDESAEALADRLQALSGVNGVSRARLYRVEEAVSGIMTSERKIYGGGPGAQRYLTLVECAASPDDMQDLETLLADRLFPTGAPQAENLFFGDYWIEMTYEKR